MDMTGGLGAADDLPNLDPQRDLDAGENHAFWVFDEHGEFAVLNCHIQAGGVPGQSWPGWDVRRVVYAIAAPDQRLFIDWQVDGGTTHDTLAAGGWTFRCVEPMTTWTASYRGGPVVTTVDENRGGVNDLSGARVPVELDLEFSMACPPWIQGTFAEELPGRDTGLDFIGIPRFEQLYRAQGWISIDGTRRPLVGTGFRTHRYGRRTLTKMRGHSWLTALFPSGRAFGSMKFPDPGTGADLFREAWVSGTDGPQAARVTDSPWLTTLECAGETWVVRLETATGPTEIRGETVATSYSLGMGADHSPGSLVMVHGMARFEWDGETTYGLIERSAPIEQLS